MLEKCLAENRDPLEFVLALVGYGEVYSRKKCPWLLGRVLKVVKEWCQRHDVSHLLTPRLRRKAMETSLDIGNNAIRKQLAEIFQFRLEKSHAKFVIGRLLAARDFKRAYHLVADMGLEHEYHINEIVFPLFFMGQESNVKDYLAKVPPYQLQFVRQLDELTKDWQISEFVSLVNADGIHPDPNLQINNKWIAKRLPGFMEHFNIGIENCPNLQLNRTAKSIYYLFRKRFVEEGIEHEPWLELTLDLVSGHRFLQNELIVKLVSINQAQLAMHVAKLLGIPPPHWPDCLKAVPECIASIDAVYVPPPTSDTSDYLKLRLDRSDIHLVDTPLALAEAVKDIVTNYNVLGMDCEWKPDMGLNTGVCKADLLQLAVWDGIYLIDVLTLIKTGDPSIWLPLLNKIFYNNDMLKLGFGTTDDMKYLLKTISHEKGQKEMPRIVDLNTVFQKLKTHFPQIIEEIDSLHPPSDLPKTKGLSQLCKNVLGKFLNKSEQFSHWAKRPMRESQIHYAALDAFCLLMIYETVYPILKKHNLDLEVVFTFKGKPAAVPKEKKVMKPVKVSEFRVVVDNNVRGAIKYLRMLGADVASLGENQDNMDAVKIAQKEHRIVLTGLRQHQKVMGYLPSEMCFGLDTELNAKEQVSIVLKHFNVICEDSALLSRCIDESKDLSKSHQEASENQVQSPSKPGKQTSSKKKDSGECFSASGQQVTSEKIICHQEPRNMSIVSQKHDIKSVPGYQETQSYKSAVNERKIMESGQSTARSKVSKSNPLNLGQKQFEQNNQLTTGRNQVIQSNQPTASHVMQINQPTSSYVLQSNQSTASHVMQSNQSTASQRHMMQSNQPTSSPVIQSNQSTANISHMAQFNQPPSKEFQQLTVVKKEEPETSEMVPNSEKEAYSRRTFQADHFAFDECESSGDDIDDLYY